MGGFPPNLLYRLILGLRKLDSWLGLLEVCSFLSPMHIYLSFGCHFGGRRYFGERLVDFQTGGLDVSCFLVRRFLRWGLQSDRRPDLRFLARSLLLRRQVLG